MSERNWGEVALLRQGFYRFFGGAMLPPDPNRVEALLAAADMLDEARVEDFAFALQWRSLTTALEDLPSPADLEAEYQRLFNAGAGGGLCPPLESEYASPPGPGRALVIQELERQYRELGMSLASQVLSTADHAATQLEVMGVLCHRESHAHDENAFEDAVRVIRAEWSFLDRHLARWFPLFDRRLHHTTPRGFFLTLVEAADAFVRHDHELVTLLAGSRIEGARR